MAPPQEAEQQEDGSRQLTEFAKRNPYLELFVPDCIENFVDALIPDRLEKVVDKGMEKVALKYQDFTTDVHEAYGEVAGVLLKVAKYAYDTFHIGDIIFGIYHLAQHHAATEALDAVEGRPVKDPALVEVLMRAADMAAWSYCPTKEELSAASGVALEDIPIMVPAAATNRPAYAVAIDHLHKAVVWGFRGTTDLEDMLTDACAACVPYCGGYAHWGMLQAARWMVDNELDKVVEIVGQHPGYELLLVGHSLGAGTATLLAHLLHHEAKDKVGGIPVRAVGVATPAVLTQDLAAGCSSYITSLVLMHDVVPRFSIHNIFAMKEEMDATKWGKQVLATAQDWAVPDVIEKTKAWQRLRVNYKLTQRRWRLNRKRSAGGLTPVMRNKVDKFLMALTTGTYSMGSWLASLLVSAGSWVTTLLHFTGLVNPTTTQEPADDGGAGGASASGHGHHHSRAHGHHSSSGTTEEQKAVEMAEMAERITDKMEEIEEEMAAGDVQQVFAPGRLFFILREDPPAEATTTPPPPTAAAASTPAEAAAAADATGTTPASTTTTPEAAAELAAAVPYPGAKFELIEGKPGQHFKRIVLRDTCLKDHLTGGYLQGLKYALDKLRGA